MTRMACLCVALICGFTTLPTQANPLLKSVPTGSWGGEHIRMVVTETGAKIEYDCALGTIDETLLLDEDNNFEAKGTHMFERGGPIRLGEPPPERHSALYHGTVDGTQMRLTVTLLETGKEVGTFLLGLGRPSLIEKCL